MNLLFRIVELEKKESEMAQTVFLSLFFVYGVKCVHNLVMHIFIHFQLSQKSLGFKLNEHLKSMFGTHSTSTQTNF